LPKKWATGAFEIVSALKIQPKNPFENLMGKSGMLIAQSFGENPRLGQRH
jgi:hypothetical protein